MRFEISDKCVSCLACVRVCPSQAIAVDGPTVTIIDESCIRAGLCLPACPHDAIDVVGDLAGAVELAARGDAVLILSVESEVHFYPHAPEQVVNACYRAGFRTVHRGVLGDELVADEYRRLFADPGWGTMIRSTCPVVVERIRRDYPELVPYLAPVRTPLGAEAAYLRAVHGAAVPIVYAGVCMAEAGPPVQAMITFQELDRLLEARGVDIGAQARFYDRIPEVRRRHVSTPGGLPLPVLESERHASRRFRKLRGLAGLDAMARAVAVDRVDLGFVDILPCEGCLDHPLMGPREALYFRRRVAAEAEPARSAVSVLDPDVRVDVETAFGFVTNGHRPSDDEIAGVIAQIGTSPKGTHWDCGACGYGRCVTFAAAYLRGRGTLRQCPPYQERVAEEAVREAAVDHLTGLSTYRVLKDRLQQEVARSERSGEPFGLLFVDLDRFKNVNDEYGHETGNRVLKSVGQELLRVVRKTDLAARYGGDEFAVVLVRTDVAGARHVGEVVRQSVEAMGRAQGFGESVVTVSVGVSSHDGRAGGTSEVLESADRALYRAKSRGGNRVVVAWDERGEGEVT